MVGLSVKEEEGGLVVFYCFWDLREVIFCMFFIDFGWGLSLVFISILFRGFFVV